MGPSLLAKHRKVCFATPSIPACVMMHLIGGGHSQVALSQAQAYRVTCSAHEHQPMNLFCTACQVRVASCLLQATSPKSRFSADACVWGVRCQRREASQSLSAVCKSRRRRSEGRGRGIREGSSELCQRSRGSQQSPQLEVARFLSAHVHSQ